MGINNLVPFLSKTVQLPGYKTHLSDYRLRRMGVDGSILLRQVASGPNAGSYVTAFIDKVDILKEEGIIPTIVFDGDANQATHEQRPTANQGNNHFSVTPETVMYVTKALKEKGINFIVSPYEAQAQLAYLDKHDLIDVVLTTEMDLLVYGCRRVIAKVDWTNGQCLEWKQRDIAAHWPLEVFRGMCILAGCDHERTPNQIGLITANERLKQKETIQQMIQTLPESYAEKFEKANNTFLYQRVYNPRDCSVVTLNPIAPDLLKTIGNYIGEELSDKEGEAIAKGRMDPITLKYFGRPRLKSSHIFPNRLPSAFLRIVGPIGTFRTSFGLRHKRDSSGSSKVKRQQNGSTIQVSNSNGIQESRLGSPPMEAVSGTVSSGNATVTLPISVAVDLTRLDTVGSSSTGHSNLQRHQSVTSATDASSLTNEQVLSPISFE